MSVDNLVNRAMDRIGNVHPVVRDGAEEVIRRAYKKGIYVLFSDGYRSHAEQNALFAQGRTAPGQVITNARGGQSMHNYGLALDMFITNKTGTSASWPVSELKKAAKIAKKVGFKWGGDWKSFPDYPHIEMTGGLKIAQLQAGQKPNIKLKVKTTKGDLTVSQYNKLLKRIQKLERSNGNTPSKTHKTGWNWLKKLKITNGKNPDHYVTRQQFATMLHRYDKKRFPKGGKVNKAHEKNWNKLTKSGITNGKDPHMPVSRGQFATLLSRYNDRGNQIKKK